MSNQAPPWSARSYMKPKPKQPVPLVDCKGCATCERRQATGEPYGPPHNSGIQGHRPHCSCDGCY